MQAEAAVGRFEWLSGPGGMKQLIREFDWAATRLGPIEQWPTSLTTVVSMMLHSRQPMFLWWGRELIQIYNDAYAPSFGVGKHPRALGQRGADCWQEIWSIIGPQIDDVLDHGKPCWFEDALVPIFRNGQLEDVYWTYGYSPVFDELGRIAGVLVVCSETTARVQAAAANDAARAAVEYERAKLFRFFEQAPAGICLLRAPDFVFEFANAQYQELVGRRDLVGKPLLEALPELAGQGFDELLRRVVETNEVLVGREVHVGLARKGTPSGELSDTYCTFIYSPMRDVAGVPEGVSVFVLDVTDQVLARRRAEALAERLQVSERELRTMADSIPQLAWSARADGYIDWYNPRWFAYTGMQLKDVEGWGWRSVHDPALVGEVVTRWQQAITDGTDFEMEFPLRRADGSFRWHLTRAVPLRDDAGRITRWFGTNTDIDDAKRLEVDRTVLLENARRERENAESANRIKDQFLATASHELRTPLSAILGWARLLRSGQLDASAYLRGVETIERNAKAQVRLIEDILDGSRIMTGKLRLEMRRLDFSQLVQAALDTVRSAAEAKDISLTAELDPLAARVVGDPERLQQVLWNLCNNAIKFTPKGGAVKVHLRRVANDIELEVTDNGQGIEASFLPHVFEHFRQGEGSTTRRFGGLGLGLSLVRHLVEAHGGSIRAESDGPGRGASFLARFPVQAVVSQGVDSVRPSPVPSVDPQPAYVDLSDVSVLVVDDELDARELVATVLRGSGAVVTIATSVAEALRVLGDSIPMVLLSDIGMPEADGYQLIRRVRTELGSAGATVPAIALTAYAREEDRRLALEAGFNWHVTKPVEPAELLRAVATAATRSPRRATSTVEELGPARSDSVAKLERLLAGAGVHEALRFLNSRTSHRFTAVSNFDGATLRDTYLFDAERTDVRHDQDAPVSDSYCSIVGTTEQAFTTADARRDDRLRSHPARERLASYCGVLLRDSAGRGCGTLRHFDRVPCDIPINEIPLMEAAARLFGAWIEAQSESRERAAGE